MTEVMIMLNDDGATVADSDPSVDQMMIKIIMAMAADGEWW